MFTVGSLRCVEFTSSGRSCPGPCRPWMSTDCLLTSLPLERKNSGHREKTKVGWGLRQGLSRNGEVRYPEGLVRCLSVVSDRCTGSVVGDGLRPALFE